MGLGAHLQPDGSKVLVTPRLSRALPNPATYYLNLQKAHQLNFTSQTGADGSVASSPVALYPSGIDAKYGHEIVSA